MLESLRRIPNSRNGHIFHNQISEFEVRFRVVRTEADFEFDGLVAEQFAGLGSHLVVGGLIFEGDFGGVLFLVNGPMEGHSDGRSVSHGDLSFAGCGWVSVIKEKCFEWICSEVNGFAIDSDNVQVKHSTVACNLVKFRRLVITSKNQVLIQLAFSLRREANMNIMCLTCMQVKLRRRHCERAKTN